MNAAADYAIGERVVYLSRIGIRIPDVVAMPAIRDHGAEYVLLRRNGMVPAAYVEPRFRRKAKAAPAPAPRRFSGNGRASSPPRVYDALGPGRWITAKDILPAKGAGR